MKTEKILLLFGFLFSVVLITFQLNEDFQFQYFKIKTALIDIAWGSKEFFLTSQFIAYPIYLSFSIFTWRKVSINGKILILIFSFLTLIGIYFELLSFYEVLNNTFTGRHFRIGVLLAIFGLYITGKQAHSNPTKE